MIDTQKSNRLLKDLKKLVSQQNFDLTSLKKGLFPEYVRFRWMSFSFLFCWMPRWDLSVVQAD